MRYGKFIESNRLIAIGTGPGGVEITKDEYDRILTEIREKAALMNQLYAGEITIEDVPVDWREEIQQRVDERIIAEGEDSQQKISGDEFMTILAGVL